MLATQPFGFVGLFQAYFLMFLLALVVLIGATRWPTRLWNAALLRAPISRRWSSSSPKTPKPQNPCSVNYLIIFLIKYKLLYF